MLTGQVGYQSCVDCLYKLRNRIAFVAMLLLWLPAALAQTPAGGDQSGEAWVPPSILELPQNWWSSMSPDSQDGSLDRVRDYLTAVSAQIEELNPENQAELTIRISSLQNQLALLEATAQLDQQEDLELTVSEEADDLEKLLQLRSHWRSLRKSQSRQSLELEQYERQLDLLDQRRGSLRQQYISLPPSSPERISAGLDSLASRIERQITSRRLSELESSLESTEKRLQETNAAVDAAQSSISADDVTREQEIAALNIARSSVLEAQEKVAASQQRLLGAIARQNANPSLLLLRRQQLSRSEAEAALAALQEAVVEVRVHWLAPPGQARQQSAAGSDLRHSELINRAAEESEVWVSSSQTTLSADIDGNTTNTRANADLARSVARDTLKLVEAIQDTADDLEFLKEALERHDLASRGGFDKAWTNFKLFANRVTNRFNGVFGYPLFTVGERPVTAGGIIKMILIVVVAYLISRLLRRLLDKLATRVSARLQLGDNPAFYSLGRVLHYVIIVAGIMIALGSVGMDFSSFALIAGALSVGIGFGLQGVVNNFVSGLILLFEGSLRVGDYIELDSGFAGTVKEINTRATLVNTNDSVDVVVPNSELTTTKLTNWTLREPIARMKIPFGVAYGSDKEKVREAALKAASEMEFVILHMPGREPQIRLVEFGDSALNFELRAWVGRQGVRRPVRTRSSFLWALDDHLRDAGIEVPFPQRDVHLKDAAPARPTIVSSENESIHDTPGNS